MPTLRAQGSKLMAQSSGLAFFPKVFILEDIRRGSNQPETHFLFAGFAVGIAFAADHDDFVSFAVFAVVKDLVDAGLADNFPRAIAAAFGLGGAMMPALPTIGVGSEDAFLATYAGTLECGQSRSPTTSGQSHKTTLENHLLTIEQ
jgi:hypothetical protein